MIGGTLGPFASIGTITSIRTAGFLDLPRPVRSYGFVPGAEDVVVIPRQEIAARMIAARAAVGAGADEGWPAVSSGW